jgi:RHS repeat-associated protein
MSPGFDTFVQQGVSTDQSTSTELRAGKDASGNVARSYLNWDVSALLGTKINSATLNVYNTFSASCTSLPVDVYPTTSTASTSTVWGSEPALGTKAASTSGAFGGPTCATPGTISATIKSLVQSWADGTDTVVGMALKAKETDGTYYKKFASADAGVNGPQISVTYNSYPLVPSMVWVAPSSPYTVGGTITTYVNSLTPRLSATVADPDGGQVSAVFDIIESGTPVASGLQGTSATTGGTSTLDVPAGTLVDGHTYTIQAWATDGPLTSKTSLTSTTSYTVDTTAPGAPTVASTTYPSGTWAGAAGTAGTFTLTPAGSDIGWLLYGLDEPTPSTAVATTGAAVPVPITPATSGSHTLYVQAKDKAGNISSTTAYQFKVGSAAITSPRDGARTAAKVQLSAEAKTTFTGVRFQYRRGSTDTWKDIPVANVTRKSNGAAITWPVTVTGGVAPDLIWKATTTLTADGTVQLQAVFTGGTGATSSPVNLVVDRNADGAATEQVGPGTVNLLTGNYTLSATDASFFGQSVSRSAASRLPAAGGSQTDMVAPFGPQWTTGWDNDVAASDFKMLRSTSTTSVELVTADDFTIGFTATTSGWTPEPGAEDMTLTGTVASGTFTLTTSDGTVTVFTKPAGSTTTFTASTTTPTGTGNTTQYVYGSVTVNSVTKSRLVKILAPTSAVSPLSSCNTAAGVAPPKGCRVLEFVYATTTTATATVPADFAGQVSQIKLWATPPGGSITTGTVVAQYAYDTTGKLRNTWDPRISPALKTSYTYDTAGRVITLTPPGEQPWTFTYGVAGSDPADTNAGRLLSASRPTLTPGTANTVNGTAKTSVVYSVPLTWSTDDGPYNMEPTDVAGWGQTDTPTDATAVFPPDQIPANNTGSGHLLTDDYGRATVHYLNVDGHRVNTAEPGERIDVVEYDKFGNTVRQMDAHNRETAMELAGEDWRLDELGLTATPTATRAKLLSTISNYSSDGVRKLDSYGPLHLVVLEHAQVASGTRPALPAGTLIPARQHTVYTYDQGRPTDGTAKAQNLVTRADTGASIDGYSTDVDVRSNTTAYDWTLGAPTRTTEDPDGLNISKTTGYDSAGRVTDTSLPMSNGADAGAVHSTYYTATGSAPCGGKPEWADMLCQIAPKGTITGGGSNPTDLVTKTITYDYYGAEDTTSETANGITRTTTTTYTAGRPTKITVAGGVGVATADTTITYDTSTGRIATKVASTGGTITHTYDTLGRSLTYTDADSNTTSVQYDALGRTTKISDSVPSTATFTYDTTIEPRGLATSVVDSIAGSFNAEYEANGQVESEQMPGSVTRTLEYDEVGALRYNVYTKTGVSDPLLDEGVTRSIHGQVVGHAGVVSAQTYGYDNTGRMASVNDTSWNGPDTCTLRTYGYDNNTNRTSQTSATGARGAGVCPTAAGPATVHTYDSGDRLVDNGYTYDTFGRTVATPTGAVVSYYNNDLVRQQTAGTARQTWELDPAGRFRSFTTETNSGGNWSTTGSSTNHYGYDTDDPTWISDNAGGTVSRNVTDLVGGLAATTTATGGVLLQLINLHGDVTVVLPVDAAQPLGVYDFDEFGQPKQTGSMRYGWLGGKQRSSEALDGNIMMGVRLYSPTLGRFASVDPVFGGSCNSYDYACQDPANKFDLDGRCSPWYGWVDCLHWKKAWNAATPYWKRGLGKWGHAWHVYSHDPYVRSCAKGAFVGGGGDIIKNVINSGWKTVFKGLSGYMVAGCVINVAREQPRRQHWTHGWL